MERSENKYLLIYRTTKSILLHPFSFGETIGDTLDDSKRAARYLGEGVIFCFAIYQAFIAGAATENFFTTLPFAGEILAVGLIAMVMLTGIFTHPVASFFSGNSRSIHGSIASFLYWTGFGIFIIWPVLVASIIGSVSLFDKFQLDAGWLLWGAMALGLPFLFVYYIGTLTSWIGRVYGMDRTMAGLAIIFSYTLSMAVGMGLYAVVSFLSEQL